MEQDRARVGIIGGTGDLGRGLASRWIAAGVDVHLGSRSARLAEQTAVVLRDLLDGRDGLGQLVPGTNREVCRAVRTLVLTVPVNGLQATLDDLADELSDRIVVSPLNPLVFDDGGPRLAPVVGGSVAASIAAQLPRSSVVAAFHTLPGRELSRVDRPMDDDVLIASDDETAAATVAALTQRIAGCRAVTVGALRHAASLEALAPVLIAVNQRHSCHAGVRLVRLGEVPGAAQAR